MRQGYSDEQHLETDLRVVRTRKLIRQAVVELTLEHGPSKLTVTGICRRAGINRSTFYRHYEGKLDLLGRGIEPRALVHHFQLCELLLLVVQVVLALLDAQL